MHCEVPATQPTAALNPNQRLVEGHDDIKAAEERPFVNNKTGGLGIYQWLVVAIVILVAYIVGSRALNKIDL